MSTSPRERLHEDGGAVLLIVAISLVALVGMLVLTVDLGSLYAERRVMVRAADAAALSAAQECVRFGSLNAEYEADLLATANESDATGGITEGADCSLGYVRVEYSAVKGLYFAPILGFRDHATVSAAAIASWSIPATLPITLDLGPRADPSFYSCPMPPAPGPECPTFPDFYVLFDNDHLSTAVWGFLTNDHGIPSGWFNTLTPPTKPQCGGAQPTTTLDIPGWACADTGVGEWQQWLKKLAKDQEYVLPLNDQKVGPPDAPNAFHIVGFAWVRVLDWDSTLNKDDPCGVSPGRILFAQSNASNVCVKFTWASGGLGAERPIRLVG